MEDTRRPPLGIVILAAGLGTRMRSERAKVLHTIAGRPLVARVLDAALTLAPERLAVVVGHDAAEVEGVCRTHLEGRDADVTTSYPRQREQRGTGDAVRAALPALEGFAGDVLVLYGDVPALRGATLQALVEHHRRERATLSLLTTVVDDPSGYGRILRRADGAVDRIVEDRDLAEAERGIREINPGIYCMAVDFLRPALAALRADNAQGEYYLTDVVGAAVAAGHAVASLPVPDAPEVAGINSRAELAEIEQRVRRSIVDHWMREGVTFRDPATAYVEADVVIGADSEIGPNIQLLGHTKIGRRCVLDGTVFVRDSTLGDAVHLKLGVVMTESQVGDRVEIGPFAQLRPGSVLEDDVRIGNFVETKKSHLGRGTKANHLSYLGDAEIGEQTNIGAGTITCNYDGFAKHRTVIGSRVQVGSDTQIVAPVTIADDAYVGAGTTVTADVPAGNLVVSRTPQRTVPGWVERRRAVAAAAKPDAKPTKTGREGSR